MSTNWSVDLAVALKNSHDENWKKKLLIIFIETHSIILIRQRLSIIYSIQILCSFWSLIWRNFIISFFKFSSNNDTEVNSISLLSFHIEHHKLFTSTTWVIAWNCTCARHQLIENLYACNKVGRINVNFNDPTERGIIGFEFCAVDINYLKIIWLIFIEFSTRKLLIHHLIFIFTFTD